MYVATLSVPKYLFLKALVKSKEYLLKIVTPDAIARSKSKDDIFEAYFAIHSYSFLGDFLKEQIKHAFCKGVVIQITTYTSLLQPNNLSLLLEAINFEKDQVTLITLQQFDSEIDFCNAIK